MEFEYQVADLTGKVISGRISADTLESAKKQLKEKGYYILEIKPLSKISFSNFFLFKRGLKSEVLYSFFRELAILLKAGLTIDKAFDILITSSRDKVLEKTLREIYKELQEGKNISEAFRRRQIFSEFIISMITAGESIGNLPQAFENIADYLKFQIQFRKDIQNTLAYPIFLIFASFITLLVIFKFILPRFFSLFQGAKLPLSAKVLLTLGSLFTGKAFLCFIGGFILLIVLYKKNYLQFVNPSFQKIFLKIPLLRGLLFNLDLSRFSYSMYSMLRGGIDFVDALYLSKNLVRLKNLREFFESCIYEIRQGKSIYEAFSRSAILPEIFYHMLRVGEETGSLKEIFFELYNIYDEKFKTTVKRLITLLEPIIITLTGIIVGFIVISLILTVMSVGVVRL
jgi:general secretion pathway protein F